MKKVILLLSTIIVFVACKDTNQNVKTDDKVASVKFEASEEKGVKLYALDGGKVQANKLEIFSQGDMYQGQSKIFADPFYIIEHKNGRLLWDAGLSENLIGQPPFTTANGAFTVSRKDSAVMQLKALNLTPKDFDFIALSHTHFDHTGSASEFADATWLVQEPEYHFITSREEKKGDNYAAIAQLKNVRQLNGDHDVFGDGTVIIKSMPGHTAGHQVLFLKLKNAGNLLLTGDLYHFQENRDNRGVPSFNFDVNETLDSMLKFETYAKAKKADVYIQHSVEDFNRLPKYPKYLD